METSALPPLWVSCLWSGSSPEHSPNNTKINANLYQLLFISRAKSNSSAWHETTFMNRHLLISQLPDYSQSSWVPVILGYLENPWRSYILSWLWTLPTLFSILYKISLPLLVGFSPISGFILKTVVAREFSWSPETELGIFFSVHICHTVVIPVLGFKTQSAEMFFFLFSSPLAYKYTYSAWYTVDVSIICWMSSFLTAMQVCLYAWRRCRISVRIISA